MDKIRKTVRWLWLAKERMVLLVMLVFLGIRVYNILNPESDTGTNSSYPPPRIEISEDVERPGIPPRVEPLDDPEDWSPLLRRPVFIYEQRRAVSPDDPDDDQLGGRIEVLSIQEALPGLIKVQIRTEATKQWYEEGEEFETYRLQSIDVDSQCCEIYDESIGRVIYVCVGDD